MRSKNVYSTGNVLWLVFIFVCIFLLLYNVVIDFHKSSKIRREISLIEEQNLEIAKEIENKKRELVYLTTPQRIEKEAKTQLGKRRENEYVLIFPEEKEWYFPKDQRIEERIIHEKSPLYSQTVSHLQKWYNVFFGSDRPF